MIWLVPFKFIWKKYKQTIVRYVLLCSYNCKFVNEFYLCFFIHFILWVFFSYHPCCMLKSEKSETPDKAKHLSLHKCNKATKASGTLKFSDIFVGINLKIKEKLRIGFVWSFYVYLCFFRFISLWLETKYLQKTKCHPLFLLSQFEKRWDSLASNLFKLWQQLGLPFGTWYLFFSHQFMQWKRQKREK